MHWLSFVGGALFVVAAALLWVLVRLARLFYQLDRLWRRL